MISSIETNTTLTREIAKDIGEVKTHLATLNGKVASHEKYIGNLDTRIVEERTHRESIKEEISYFKGGIKIAVALWSALSAIVVGTVTHYLSK